MAEGATSRWTRPGSLRLLLGVLGFEFGLGLGRLLGFEGLAEYIELAFHPHAAGLLAVGGPRPAALPEEAVLAHGLAGPEQVGRFWPQHGRVTQGHEAAEFAIQKVVELRADLFMMLTEPALVAFILVGARQPARRGRQEPHLGEGAQRLAESVARDAIERIDFAAERKLAGWRRRNPGGRRRFIRGRAGRGATAQQDSGQGKQRSSGYG